MRLAAQQIVQRNAKHLRLDVPQRHLDRARYHQRQAGFAPGERLGTHLVEKAACFGRVLADNERRIIFHERTRRKWRAEARIVGFAEAPQAALGGHFNKHKKTVTQIAASPADRRSTGILR